MKACWIPKCRADDLWNAQKIVSKSGEHNLDRRSFLQSELTLLKDLNKKRQFKLNVTLGR